MTDKDDKNTPQNMTVDEFFGEESANDHKPRADSNSQINNMVNDLNESLHNSRMSIDSQNIVIQLLLEILPLPYARKRQLRDKAARGERLTILDLIFGEISLMRVIRFMGGLLIFVVILLISSQR